MSVKFLNVLIDDVNTFPQRTLKYYYYLLIFQHKNEQIYKNSFYKIRNAFEAY